MTATTAKPEPSVPEVLKVLNAGGCSKPCLLSAPLSQAARRRCTCRCAGEFHGLVLSTLTRQAETATAAPNGSARQQQRKAGRT